jgi:hypoxanthine phosphoribosyltransferase
VLTGGFMFACDLVRELGFPVRLEFISISRYAGAATSGEVQILKDVQDELTGKHVLLVEDIVDTGVSLHYLGRTLLLRRPASLSICALLERPALRLAEVPVRYVGFQLNSEFLVGYGLDYRGRYRNLPYLATLEDGPGPRFS